LSKSIARARNIKIALFYSDKISNMLDEQVVNPEMNPKLEKWKTISERLKKQIEDLEKDPSLSKEQKAIRARTVLFSQYETLCKTRKGIQVIPESLLVYLYSIEFINFFVWMKGFEP